jgi:hypothetical protein
VLRVRIVISVVGGGIVGVCGCDAGTKFGEKGGELSRGWLALVAVYSLLVLRGVCASRPSVGLVGRGVCGKLSRLSEARGSDQMGAPRGAGCG